MSTATGSHLTTKRQRDIMAHAINLEGRLKGLLGSRKLRVRSQAKKAVSDLFRNYYCASVGGEDAAEIAKLCEMGLMRKGPTINNS